MSSPRVLEACHEDAVSRDQWLEQELVGPSLAILVGELAVLGGPGSDDRAFSAREAAEWLGDDLEAVLGRGLGALSKKRIDELFRRPAILGGLQELVLVEGGDHWDDLVSRHEVLAATAAFHRRQLARRLGLAEPPEESPNATSSPHAGRRNGGRGVILALAAAAVVGAILAVVVLPRLRSAGTADAPPVDDHADAEPAPTAAPEQAATPDATAGPAQREPPPPTTDPPTPEPPRTDTPADTPSAETSTADPPSSDGREPAIPPADGAETDPGPAAPPPAAKGAGEAPEPAEEPATVPAETAEPDSPAPAPVPEAAARRLSGRRSLPPLRGRCTLLSCGQVASSHAWG